MNRFSYEIVIMSKNGIHDLHWPLCQDELLKARDFLITGFLKIALSQTKELDSRLASLFTPLLTIEALLYLQAGALRENDSQSFSQGFKLLYPRYAALTDYEQFPPTIARSQVESGPFIGSRAKWAPKYLRDLWSHFRSQKWNQVSVYDYFRQWLKGNTTLSLQYSPLVIEHMRLSNSIVAYKQFGQLIASPKPKAKLGENSSSQGLLSSILNLIEQCFQFSKVSCPDRLLDHLALECGFLFDFAIYYFDLLGQMKLPALIWTGTGGNIWVRILRHAAKANNSLVVGHDHGIGGGVLDTPIEIVEFESCDHFVCLNKLQKQVLSANYEGERAIFNLPRLKSLEDFGKPDSIGVKKASKSRLNPVKTVMFTSAGYYGERMWLTPWLPDLVLLDFELRLFSKLRRWNLNVISKPHPASVMDAPKALKNLGVNVLYDPFEQVIGLADAFIFIDFTTSILLPTVATNKPIIFLDFGITQFRPNVRERFEKSIDILTGWFDMGNRAMINWDELKSVIKERREIPPHDSAYEYLSLSG